MRQNREQLLAKQQILEQYARQQKQLQLRKQAMSQQNMPSQLQTSSNAFNNFKFGNNQFDRVASLPPGMNMRGSASNRYDLLPDRISLHRSPSNQRSGAQQTAFGNGLPNIQSRSVSDIRLDGAGMLQERMPFSQLSEQNLFLEQRNRNLDLYTSHY